MLSIKNRNKGSITIVYIILITICLMSVAIVSSVAFTYSMNMKNIKRNQNEYALGEDAHTVYRMIVSSGKTYDQFQETGTTNYSYIPYLDWIQNKETSKEVEVISTTDSCITYTIENSYLQKYIQVILQEDTTNAYGWKILSWKEERI